MHEKTLRIIYEDNHLLVCEKPANMPVQADASGDIDLLTLAKSYIKAKYNKPGEVYLGLVHRLDRPVAGVMVFARTSKAAARLTESFKTRRTKKRYAAVVTGRTRAYAGLEDWLLRDTETNMTRAVPEGTPGAKHASLDYTRVTTKNGRSLLDIELHTGRHHQIRVQLSERGMPIYGDQRYDPNAEPHRQIALHAYSITIEHPTLKSPMTFTCMPKGGVWDDFSEELTALSCGVRCIYIDKNIICVNKQAGIACTAVDAGENEGSLEADLTAAFGPGSVYPVHRLDVLTTGLVLFARNPAAQRELTGMIKRRELKKYYHAEVFGCPNEPSGRLRVYAQKDAENAVVHYSMAPAAGAAEMLTDYRVLKTDGNRSLIELELITGRTHQIRTSLAAIGCPVIGDDKYGDRRLNKTAVPAGLRLAAVRLKFPESKGMLSYLSGKTLENEAEFRRGGPDGTEIE